ncbi:hypothetical protein QTA56_13910 [Acinetobacter sp. VNH17]|uniref:Uncharacterized protein n=1 Tax=Acinetobacter thutiue TaxID=2998078 RepID=A0ABT7WRL6_9GAMM|nr:hypothetical protein [Acinetobacter thutiue]MCY6413209.1 hypothetical protein [Acinetobacter thutiue]MDN0015318.1 hypothetical protein [Acinetobacter thutiue]
MSIDKNSLNSENKMLKRVDISTYCCHSVEIDGYIPFSICFNEKSPDLYWRGGNGQNSLVEIGLLKTGELSTITLVSFSRQDLIENHKDLFYNESKKTYLPIFDVSFWMVNTENFSNIFIDKLSSELRLFIGKNYVEVTFLPLESAIDYVKDSNFGFGFNDDELVALQILNLEENRINLLRESLQ